MDIIGREIDDDRICRSKAYNLWMRKNILTFVPETGCYRIYALHTPNYPRIADRYFHRVAKGGIEVLREWYVRTGRILAPQSVA